MASEDNTLGPAPQCQMTFEQNSSSVAYQRQMVPKDNALGPAPQRQMTFEQNSSSVAYQRQMVPKDNALGPAPQRQMVLEQNSLSHEPHVNDNEPLSSTLGSRNYSFRRNDSHIVITRVGIIV
nr:hypothetical protein [Tanacetum cinerariifolium]